MTTDELTANTCSHCQKSATFMCSSCGQDGPRYCSIECQTDHWKENHYRVCKAARRNRQRHAEAIAAAEADTTNINASSDIPMNDLSPNQDQEKLDDEEDAADELRFYTLQIYRIIKPVVACIILSIFWVKVSYSGSSDYSPTRPNYVNLAPSTPSSSSDGSTSSGPSIANSFTNAAIIIGQIIGVTILIVFLFKKGWIKVLIGFFMVIVLLLLGFMTYLLLLNLIQVFLIALDYITLVFALWNFAVVGLVSIFWRGPLWLQQSYLTIMSSLMAFSLTGLEQWTTWILLGLLAIWDLIAVLCPFGPLRLLIESSRNQQREVPALLYSVNAVWFMMASNDHFRLSNSMLGTITPAESTTTTHETVSSSSNNNRLSVQHHSPSSFIQHNFRKSHDGFMRLPDDSHVTIDSHSGNSNPFATQTTLNVPAESANRPSTPRQEETARKPAEPENDEEDAERSGLKLGLGDFVFYSVLIARAATYDWITTVCCTIAVLTGLTATIFLLAIYKKALPALPISIAFGMLFYFVAKTVLVPYVGALCVFGMVGL
ncbi:mitochondral 37S ribosomal protein S27 [Mucor velutinosus]|uniref:Presenilin n=1 Tax=Mucor velutinosus TaxID=708070 RepID=A0AAN7DPG3_9FUNG|nr:mitochondral 37S ribosomal protein S27 [Mucor velutinosus]